jgi:hypothetical protein
LSVSVDVPLLNMCRLSSSVFLWLSRPPVLHRVSCCGPCCSSLWFSIMCFSSRYRGPPVKVFNIFNTVIGLSHLWCHNVLYFLNNPVSVDVPLLNMCCLSSSVFVCLSRPPVLHRVLCCGPCCSSLWFSILCFSLKLHQQYTL